MILAAQTHGRNVQISLLDGLTVVRSIDASWTVGSGQTFANALHQLLGNESESITKLAAAIHEPSYTTVRIVLAALNTLRWALLIPFVEAPQELATQSPEQFAGYLATHQLPSSDIVFPTYDDRIPHTNVYSGSQ